MRRHNTQARGNFIRALFTTGLLLCFLMIAGTAGLFIFDRVYSLTLASDILPNFTVGHMTEEGTPEVRYEPGKPLPRWEGTERVNVLVMGIDQREHEQGPWRTDTMLVLTIDPVTKSGGMLSIPRDLWVPIPGFREGRINTAHYLGDVYDYPGGGPALAVKTVQYNLGVPIHYYVRLNFTAFEKLVDLIGGIDVYVEEEINDPTYPDEAYGYDPFHVPAGWQHLNGEMALKYARTRHTPGGDFDRARRQQQVIMAVFDQVKRLDLLPQLAARAPELWRTLEGAVVTDLTLDKMIALGQLALEVPPENIRYGVIDEHYTQFWTTQDGQQVLIPLRDRMRELRDYIFTTNAPLPQQTEEPATRLAREAAVIKVLNGTTREGLARQTTEYLQQQGFNLLEPDNADHSDYARSMIIVYTGKTYTAEYLARLLGLMPGAVVHEANAEAGYDIAIILGADYQPVQPLPQPSPTPSPAPVTGQ
ncbi:MAG: LCP family protein [Anaerolineae bacterium]|nr:LCP family protein [Anaerolineae bacterium]